MWRPSKRMPPRADQFKIRSISFCCRCCLGRAGSTWCLVGTWRHTTLWQFYLSWISNCSADAKTLTKITLGTNVGQKIYISMYPWSDIEENVAVHLLKGAIREKSSDSRSSEKVRGKAARKGSDKKWLISHCNSSWQRRKWMLWNVL